MANEFVIRIRADDAATATVNKIKAALSKVTEPVEKSQKQLGKLGDVGQAGLQKLSKGLGGVARAAGKVVDRIVEIIPGLTAIGGAASLAGLAGLAERFASFGFGLNKSSKLLGVSTTDLQAWHIAAQRAGVTAEQFDQSVSGSQNTIRAAAFGADPHAMMLMQKMGVQIHRNNDGSIDYLGTQQRIMKALAGQRDAVARRNTAEALGMGALLPMIERGTWNDDKADAFRKGLVMSPDAIARATEFQDRINNLKQSVGGFANTLGDKLIPVLEPVVEKISLWLDDHKAEIADKLSMAVEKFVTWISSINWDAVTGKASAFVDAIGGLKGVAIAIAAITFAGPIAGVLGLIANLTKLSTVVIPAALAQLGLLAAAGYAAENARQKALDSAIPAGENHDQQVADAQAGGVVTPDSSGAKNQDLGGRFYRWLSGMVGGSSNTATTKDVVSQLQAQGWNKNSASGIAANLWAESKFDPTAVGDNGHAYGIGQWHEDRQALFKKWAGHDIHGSTLSEQLRFVDYELKNGDSQSRLAGRALPLVHSAEAAGRIVSQYYDRPADVEGEARRRGALAGAIASSPGADSEGSSPAQPSVAGAAADSSPQEGDRAARLASLQSAAPQVHVTVNNAQPGTTVDAKTPDGGYLPTRVNYALGGNMGAMP